DDHGGAGHYDYLGLSPRRAERARRVAENDQTYRLGVRPRDPAVMVGDVCRNPLRPYALRSGQSRCLQWEGELTGRNRWSMPRLVGLSIAVAALAVSSCKSPLRPGAIITDFVAELADVAKWDSLADGARRRVVERLEEAQP